MKLRRSLRSSSPRDFYVDNPATPDRPPRHDPARQIPQANPPPSLARLAVHGLRDVDNHPVIGRLHAGRQPCNPGVVVDLMVHVREDRPARAYPPDPGQGLVEMAMPEVRPVLEAVDGPHLDAGQHRKARFGHCLDVGRIGEFAEPQAENRVSVAAMLLPERLDGEIADLERPLHRPRDQGRDIPDAGRRPRAEGITETPPDLAEAPPASP